MNILPFQLNVPAEVILERPGERFQLCKTQVRKGNRRSIEWVVRRVDPSEPEPDTQLAPYLQLTRPLQPPSWSTPSRPQSPPLITPSDTAPNWATWCDSMGTQSSPWRLRC